MQTVIIVIHLMVVLAMIGAVLLQKSEGGGLGIGSTGGFLTSRGTANMLTRTTAILAGIFFVTSLLLSILATYGSRPTSILGGPAAPVQQQDNGKMPTPKAGDLLKDLQTPSQPAGAPASGQPANTAPTQPAQPAQPSGPQVPNSR
jgi:preprotein translocase subunit SecG